MHLINQVYGFMVYGIQRHFPQRGGPFIGGGNRGTRGENHRPVASD